MLTRYEESILGKLDAIGAMRKLVREQRPEAVLTVLDDFRERRVRVDALPRVSHALTLAQVDAAVDRSGPGLDLDAVLNDPELRAYFAVRKEAAPRDLSVEEFDTAMRSDIITCWHLLAHHRAKNRVYEVTPGLALKLKATELRGLTADDLRLPFEAVSIQVPREADLGLQRDFGRALFEEYYLAEEAGPPRRWRLWVCGLTGQGPSQDLVFYLNLPDGKPLDECIAEARAKTPRASGLAFHQTEQDPAAGMSAVRGGDIMDDWETLFRWAMNVIVYATNDGARQEVWGNPKAEALRGRIAKLPPGKKRDGLKDRLRAVDPKRRIVLGPNVRLEVIAGGASAPLTVRVRVQGHWKRQPVGPGRADRKLIWIEPYWRGPDDAPPASITAHVLK